MAILTDKSYSDYYQLHCLAYEYNNSIYYKVLIEKLYIFLNDYIELFKTGSINPNNSSTRYLLRYFSKTPDKQLYKELRKRARKKSINSVPAPNAIPVANFRKALSRYSIYDYTNEIFLALYTMCSRYKSIRPSFHTYINKVFHYTLLESIKKEVSNSYINTIIYDTENDTRVCNYTKSMFNVIDKDASYKLNLDIASKSKPTLPYNNAFSDSFFDYNWISGNYQNSIFNFLSSTEREMLKLNLIDKVSQEQIGYRYGFCRNTIINKFKIIRNKLENHFNQKTIYGQCNYIKKGK